MSNNITPIAAAVASITVSRSRTVNLGNYENEQIFVSATIPVTSDFDSAYNELNTYVQEKVDAEVALLQDKSVNKVAKARSASKPAEEVEEVAEVKKPIAEEVNDDEIEEAETSDDDQADIGEVKTALKSIKDEFGNDAYKGIMKEFGYSAIAKIEEDQHNALIAACDAYRAEQADTPADDDLDGDDDLDDDDDLDKAETSVTEDDVKDALREYIAENGKGSHREILKKFGAAKVSDIKLADYANVIAECV